MNWVQPKFSDFVTSVNTKKRKRKDDNNQNSPNIRRRRTEPEDQPESSSWAARYAPKTRSELIVNKKKIDEVESWLRSKEDSNILLVTGPSGCGKLTSLRVLCKDLGIGTSEWITPETKPFEPGVWDDSYVSQSKSFEEFVLRASRYTSLLAPKASRVVLVKDVPPVFIRNPSSFHSLLDRCAAGTKVAFLLNDSSLVSELFPDEVREKCQVTTVAFNAITRRALGSVLNRVVCQEAPTSEARSVAASLAEGVDGDLHHGLAALQFYVTGSDIKLSGLMDPNVDLFRGVGRALYAKREVDGKLIHRPEDVAAACPPSALMGLLQENYTSVIADLETAEAVANGFSLSDLLSAHSEMTELSADISVRSVMVHNSAPIRKFQAFARARSGPVAALGSELRASMSAAFLSTDVTTIITESTYFNHLSHALTHPQQDVIKRLTSFRLVESLRR